MHRIECWTKRTFWWRTTESYHLKHRMKLLRWWILNYIITKAITHNNNFILKVSTVLFDTKIQLSLWAESEQITNLQVWCDLPFFRWWFLSLSGSNYTWKQAKNELKFEALSLLDSQKLQKEYSSNEFVKNEILMHFIINFWYQITLTFSLAWTPPDSYMKIMLTGKKCNKP